jgi:hypothetical protein
MEWQKNYVLLLFILITILLSAVALWARIKDKKNLKIAPNVITKIGQYKSELSKEDRK